MLILGFNNLLGHDVSSWHTSFPSKSTEKYLESIVWGIIGGIVAALILGGTFVPSCQTRHPFRRSQGCRVHRGIPPGLLFRNSLGPPQPFNSRVSKSRLNSSSVTHSTFK